MTLTELRREWRALRDELVNARVIEPEKGSRLIALRDEIDRRESVPVVDVDFEKYITD